MAEKLNYGGIEFPVKEKDLTRLKWKTIYVVMCLVMNMGCFFQFIFQIRNLKAQWTCYF